ncbi:hypothetical protein [Sulfurimonas sp.]|uniref:hypothetical protein n=1 Tax=Sulfurimonas sp. TaxID=2022749 RepID=UPI002AB046CA|nr:hypothetical protein [Sulfurimonas sp.]
MCMPHGGGSRSNGYIEINKVKKHIQKVSQEQFEKGDPNFIDERKNEYVPKKKKAFFSFFE